MGFGFHDLTDETGVFPWGTAQDRSQGDPGVVVRTPPRTSMRYPRALCAGDAFRRVHQMRTPGSVPGAIPGSTPERRGHIPLSCCGDTLPGVLRRVKKGPRGSYLGPPNPPLSAGPIFPLATVGIRPRGGQKGSKRGPRGHFGVHFGTPSGTPPGRVYTKNLV